MKLCLLSFAGACLNYLLRFTNRAVALHQQSLIARHTNSPYLAGRGYVTGISKLELEDNIFIGKDFFLRADGGLKIGANTHISHKLTVYTINHDYHGELLPYDDKYITRPVVIGRNVWIGYGVTILPGAFIEDGAIIGAGAVIAGRVDKCGIVGAAAGKMIKTRDKEHYDRLDARRSYSARGGKPLR